MGIEFWDRTGISVEESARRLQRVAYVDRMLMRTEAGHMIARPEYEIKGVLARMIWRDASHYDQLRNRCKQLRMNVKAFDKCPDTNLRDMGDHVLNAPSTLCLLISLFEVIKPEQITAIRTYLQLAQPLVDEPTIHLLHHQLIDREEEVKWGEKAIRELRDSATEEELAFADRWKLFTQDMLRVAGGLDYTYDKGKPDPKLVLPTVPFKLPLHSTRDARFTSAVKKFKDIEFEDNDNGRFMTMIFHRFFEMSPAEGVAYVHFVTEGKPWSFYYDTAKHMWDEVRHAWFGEAALRSMGYDISAVPNWTGWYEIARHCLNKDEVYIHLTVAIEKAAMKYPPGKREEWEFCRDVVQHPLMTTFQDFDWADEVVHAGYGQKWIIDDMFQGDVNKAMQAAEETMRKRSEFMSKYEQDESEPLKGGY